MNGRSLLAIICVLFVVGIFWMVMVIPQIDTSETAIALFERRISIPKKAAVSSEQKEPTLAEQAVPTPSEKKEPTEEKPKPETAEAASDEPPESVEYTPKYGRVSFTHIKHMDDYEIDCSDCHHEDMEGGMSKCANCHEPPKNALHKNCQGCHKDLQKEGKKTGPVKCKECHIKGPHGPTRSSEPAKPAVAEQATPTPSEQKEPTEEKPKPETAEAASDEPPELVEYTPKYGRVSFTHMKHMDDYEIDCSDCHHEDMEGGMSKCANCHEPPKNALHENCQGCHKDLQKDGKKTGPVKCRECHVKETG